MRIAILTAALMMTAPAFASSPDAWAEHDKEVADACIPLTGFKDAKIHTNIMTFSDDVGYTAVVIEGTYSEPHMNGAKGMMLCLYKRGAGLTEVTEMTHAE
jgi:ABC-type proline/glycine betaine transport system substrate-binding protein